MKPRALNWLSLLGAVPLQSKVPLWIRSVFGSTESPVRFVIDSGAMMTTIGIDRARDEQLPAPPDGSPEYPMSLTTASGSDANTRFSIAQCDVWWDPQGDPFEWPICFFTHPAPLRNSPPLLGLAGVTSACTWTVRGPQSPTWDDGAITLEDIRPLRKARGKGSASK